VTGRTGEWPITKPVDLEAVEVVDEQGQQHLELVRVQARFRLVLDSIRADLREQPSEVSVRGAARRWTNAITAMADEIAKELRSTA
jgi:hypothetical protein